MSKETLAVYHIVENKIEGKAGFWARIGSAWTNKDGSFNVHLFAMPIDGKMQIRPIDKDTNKEK